MRLDEKSVFSKVWSLVEKYLLQLRQFDLCVQGSLLILILLETNVFLLLTRDAQEGHHPALVQEWVKVGCACAEFLLGAGLAWLGRDHKRRTLSCLLAVTAVFGCVVLAFPYAVANPAQVELCGGSPVSSYSSRLESVIIIDGNLTYRTVALVITALLCCLTKASIWAHGLTYLDDHDPQNGAYYYGILISIRLSLGLSGTNWLSPGSVREDWWVAQLTLSLLTLTFAVFFSLFPKRMPYFEESGDANLDTGFVVSVKRIVNNKALMLQTIGLSFLSAAVYNFVFYDKPYVQGRFHVEAYRTDLRASRGVTDIFRSLVIVFFILIFRVRFSARRLDGVKTNTASRVAGVVAIFVTIIYVVISFIGCNVDSIASFETGVYEPQLCSQDCGCNVPRYGFSPVCALDSQTTFFSPCDAGCRSVEDLNGLYLYHNCTCGSDRAVRGSCSLTTCILPFNIYQVLFTLQLAVAGASLLMQGMAILRAVRQADKSVAVGTSFALVALLSFVLGHLFYMWISYATCLRYANGSCLLHNQTIWSLSATSAGLAAMSAIFSILASKVPPEIHVPSTEL